MQDWQAYLFSLGMVLGSVFMLVYFHQHLGASNNVGLQMRVATSSLIYKKVEFYCLNSRNRNLNILFMGNSV